MKLQVFLFLGLKQSWADIVVDIARPRPCRHLAYLHLFMAVAKCYLAIHDKLALLVKAWCCFVVCVLKIQDWLPTRSWPRSRAHQIPGIRLSQRLAILPRPFCVLLVLWWKTVGQISYPGNDSVLPPMESWCHFRRYTILAKKIIEQE